MSAVTVRAAHGWSGVALVIALVIGATLTVRAATTPASASPDVAQAGAQPRTERIVGLAAKSAKVRDNLKFRVGVQSTARHISGVIAADDVDEVDEVDANGKPVSAIAFDASGQLRSAVRLDLPPKAGARIGRVQALESAKKAIAALGLSSASGGRADGDASTDGWTVQFDRFEGGVPVRGDGVSVDVWPDGTVAAVSRSSHPLAVAPKATLENARALDSVKRFLDARIPASRRGDFKVSRSTLAWVSPNDSLNPNSGHPAGLFRLAWIVDVRTTGKTADGLTQLTIYVDAEDGDVIGGDVVQ